MAENKDFLIKEETLTDIADSIRNVDNTLKELSPAQMSEEIKRLTAIIEQDFDANSPNAQSGKAVAEAVNIEKERAMAAEKTEQENRDMADNKLQSQINNIVAKQETQQDKVITRTLSENTVTETFDAPTGEQILILQDENKTGSIKFDKTNNEVTITSNGKLKLHNVDTPENDLDAANKEYVDTTAGSLTNDLNAEIDNRTKADKALQTQITDNAKAIAENETNLVDETTERKAEDGKLTQSIADEQTAREAKDTELEGKINSNTTAISTETKNRTDADTNLQNQITTNKTNLTQEIADRKAADSALEQKISDITAVQIRNKSEVIESTEADVQETATNYIKNNYDRDPQNWDGLIITVTDKQNDKILYIYSEASKLWINSGINDVDLSNYYTKDQVYSKTEIDTTKQNVFADVSGLYDNTLLKFSNFRYYDNTSKSVIPLETNNLFIDGNIFCPVIGICDSLEAEDFYVFSYTKEGILLSNYFSENAIFFANESFMTIFSPLTVYRGLTIKNKQLQQLSGTEGYTYLGLSDKETQEPCIVRGIKADDYKDETSAVNYGQLKAETDRAVAAEKANTTLITTETEKRKEAIANIENRYWIFRIYKSKDEFIDFNVLHTPDPQ